MPKFTKKPVEVEARQFDGTQGSAKAVCAWMAAYGCEALRAFCGHDEPYQVYISTLEGRMTASAGDWIIRGVKGEFYPCKPDIFADTYEPSALSHAAGQDGEQCRAASELDPSELSSLKQRAAAWDAVAATCREIDPDALAVYGPTGRESVVAFIRALSRGVPEGRQVLPEGWRVSIERGIPGVMWLELNGPKCSTSAQARKQDDVQWRIYERYEAAIAAQRKEG